MTDTTKNKNLTITHQQAAKFFELRDEYNDLGRLPFPVTNSQFLAVLMKSFRERLQRRDPHDP